MFNLFKQLLDYILSLLGVNSLDKPKPTPYVRDTIVLDLSHYNPVKSFLAVKGAGVAGVILKATQGVSIIDPKFVEYRRGFQDAGLLVGAYHFGTGDNVEAQVNHFLQVVKPAGNILLALDFEPNPKGLTMTLKQAQYFMEEVYRRTGQKPKFYSGSLIKQLTGNQHDSILCNYPFWLAQYGPVAKVPPTWEKYWLWQFSDRGKVAGIEESYVDGIEESYVDMNRYKGSVEQLKKEWA